MNYILYVLLFIIILFFIYKKINYKEGLSLREIIALNTEKLKSNDEKIVPIYMPNNSVIDKNDINIIDLKPFYNEKIKNDITNSINKVNNIYFSNKYLDSISKTINIDDKKMLL